MSDAGAKFTYRITAEGVDAVKHAFRDLAGEIAAAAGIGGLGYMIENSLKTATNIQKMSREAGMSTRTFQEWSFALRQFGIDEAKASEEMTKFSIAAAEFVTKNSGPGKEAFQRLGFSQKDVQEGLQNADEFFGVVLDKIGQLKSEAEKLQLLRAIFGKSGDDLIGPANAGLDAMRAFREEAEKLGVVMSDDVIKKADDAQNRLETLAKVLHMQVAIAIDENADKLEHLAQIGIDMLPELIKLADDLATAFERAAQFVKELADGDIKGAFDHLSQAMTDSWKNTVMPGLVNPTHVSLDMLMKMQQQPAGQVEFTNLSNMAFRHNYPQDGDFYSIMGLKAPPPPKPTAPASGYKLPIGDPAADAQREANAKLIESLRQEAEALGISERQLAVVTAQRRLNTLATKAQKDEVAALAGKIYDEHLAMQDQKYLEGLQKELQLMGLSDRERAVRIAQQHLSVQATQEEIDKAGDYAAAIYDEAKATEELKKQTEELQRSFREAGDDVAQAFEDMSIGGKSFSDVLTTLEHQLLSLAYKRYVGNDISDFVFGTLDGLLGRSSYDDADTSFMSMFGGGRAGGGGVEAGMLYRVNENKREYFRPNVGGQVIPMGGGEGGGVSVTLINQGTPMQVTGQQVRRGSDGSTEILMMIDDAMAVHASNPLSKFSGAMRDAAAVPTPRY